MQTNLSKSPTLWKPVEDNMSLNTDFPFKQMYWLFQMISPAISLKEERLEFFKSVRSINNCVSLAGSIWIFVQWGDEWERGDP